MQSPEPARLDTLTSTMTPNEHNRMADEPSTLHKSRKRLRPWLINEINSGKIKGLGWIDQERTMCKIPWKHAGQKDYDPEENFEIFKRWSENTEKYKKGVDPEEPAVWKTRPRTASNKDPGIQKLTGDTMLNSPEPYRIYRRLHSKSCHGHPQKSPRPPSSSEPNYAFTGNYGHRRPPNGMQQPFGRDPQDLADVLDAIAPEDDGRNMMPPQMTDFLSLFHVSNNDPRQTGGYVPNQEYYPLTASPAPTTGCCPESQFAISSQTNQQQQVSILQQQQQCLVYSEASEPNEVVMNELPRADCLPAGRRHWTFEYGARCHPNYCGQEPIMVS